MKLTATQVEVLVGKNIQKYSLAQVEATLSEVQETLKKFKNFEFKKEGLKMTAMDFFRTQESLKKCQIALKNRRRAILKVQNGK